MKQQHISEARRIIERRRQDAQTKAINRREEFFKNAPEMQTIEDEIAKAGAGASVAAINKDAKLAEEKMQQLHALKLKKKELFKKIGIREAFLKPDYKCKICGDTGKFEGKTCQCFKEVLRDIRREKITENGALKLCQFENFSLEHYPQKTEDGTNAREIMAGILKDSQHYAQQFGKASGSLFMYGDAGLGKTHLALSIATVVLDKGFDVIYVSSQSAFSQISINRFDKSNILFKTMMEAQLLILDDLGTEFIDAYVLSKLYEIINGRMRKPTIYTTNIHSQELLNHRYTEKIASRLMGECHRMKFCGDDIRLVVK